MKPQRPDDDALLSAYLDGRLAAEELAALEARLEAEPALAAQLDALRGVLAEPLLEPLAPPAALSDWVRAQARAEAASQASVEADVLAGASVPLEPLGVPPRLEAWVRRAARHARQVEAGAPRRPPRRERLAPALRWRAAAALLASLGLGLLLGRSLRPAPAEAAALRTARARLEQQDARLRQAEQEAASLRAERDAARTQRDDLAAARADLQTDLRQRAQELTGAVAERDRLQLALGRLGGQRDRLQEELTRSRETTQRLPELEQALASARAEADAAREQAERQTAALRAELEELRQRAPQPVAVTAAQGLERWDQARGWQPLRAGEQLPVGAVLRGGGLDASLVLEQRRFRVGQGLYLLQADGLRPLPSQPQGDGAGLLAEGRPERREPGGPQRVMASVSPLQGLGR